MALHTNQDMTEEEMREAFRVFDKDSDGNIPEAEMRNVLATLKTSTDITEEEIDEIILLGDADENGCFDMGGNFCFKYFFVYQLKMILNFRIHENDDLA